MNSVILVDEFDNVIGTMDKMQAHLSGKLHRAFSVFIFNTNGELLMQQRALDKYHSAGKWTNTCCSHPAPGESSLDGANRRLMEEMGLRCELSYGFHFIYNAVLESGLTEYEYDHVYLGVSNEVPVPDPTEVVAYEYVSMASLSEKLERFPGLYSEWLKICFEQVAQTYQQLLKNV